METKCRVNKFRVQKVKEIVEAEPGPRPRIRVQNLDGTISPGPDDYPGPYEPDILIIPAEGVQDRIDEEKFIESMAGKSESELKAILDDLRRKVAEAEGNGKE